MVIMRKQFSVCFQVIFVCYTFVGAAKEALIVTPLMDFVRQKRAAKAGPRVYICYIIWARSKKNEHDLYLYVILSNASFFCFKI